MLLFCSMLLLLLPHPGAASARNLLLLCCSLVPLLLPAAWRCFCMQPASAAAVCRCLCSCGSCCCSQSGATPTCSLCCLHAARCAVCCYCCLRPGAVLHAAFCCCLQPVFDAMRCRHSSSAPDPCCSCCHLGHQYHCALFYLNSVLSVIPAVVWGLLMQWPMYLFSAPP